MKFSDALEARKPIDRIGDVRLRFDTDMLVGEGAARPGWIRYAAEGALIIAAAAALTCAVVALSPGSPAGASVPIGLVAAGSALAGVRLEIARRARRGFILHFANRTLRVERPSRWLGSTTTVLAAFKDIREAGVTRAPKGYALEVELAPRSPKRRPRVEVLIAAVNDSDLEDLFRVAELTRAAVGLTPPEEEAAARSIRTDPRNIE